MLANVHTTKKLQTWHDKVMANGTVISDEEDDSECEEVLEEMETIDGETDNLDITFVKIADPKYARKWGVTKLPSLVYFRKRFPSIYRGNLN